MSYFKTIVPLKFVCKRINCKEDCSECKKSTAIDWPGGIKEVLSRNPDVYFDSVGNWYKKVNKGIKPNLLVEIKEDVIERKRDYNYHVLEIGPVTKGPINIKTWSIKGYKPKSFGDKFLHFFYKEVAKLVRKHDRSPRTS